MARSQIRSPDVYGRTFQMEYMAEIGLAGAEKILDLGCGRGIAARAIARHPEVHEPVAAIDISAHLVMSAGASLRKRASAAGSISRSVTRTAPGCRTAASTWSWCTR
jgi:trans-aconitate methyltransferase